MEALTIGEVAQRAGIQPSTIRYYESIELLSPARRVSGQRRYDETILERLAFIQVAQKLRFTLSEIRLLLHHQEERASLSESWQGLARQKINEVESIIQRASSVKTLLMQGLHCDCFHLDECIDCVLMNCAEVQSK